MPGWEVVVFYVAVAALPSTVLPGGKVPEDVVGVSCLKPGWLENVLSVTG